MAYILNSKKLQKGDILLAKFDNTHSIRIREVLNSSFSHATLYLGNHSFIEADTDGVELFSSNRYAFGNPDNIKLLRLKDEYVNHIDDIVFHARKYSFRDYNKSGVLDIFRAKINNSQITEKQDFTVNEEWNKPLFCSQLIGVVYSQAGINLYDNISLDNFSLFEIENSDRLVEIPDYLIEIPDSYLSNFTMYGEESLPENILTMQREKGKIISKSIIEEYKQNNLEPPIDFHYAIDNLLKLNPDEIKIADEIISRNIIKSGYLDIWKENRKLNPNLYDPYFIMECFNIDNYEEMQLAIVLLNDIIFSLEETINFQEENFKATDSNFKQSGAETFELLGKMYSNFVNDLNDAKQMMKVSLMPLELINNIMTGKNPFSK